MFIYYYPASLDDVRAIRLAAQTLERDGTSSYGMSVLTKRITCVSRPIIQSFNYDLSVQGSIPKYALFTCVDRSSTGAPTVASAENGIVVDALSPIFVPGQYSSKGSYELCQKITAAPGGYPNSPLGFYGIGHRFCPEMS